MPAEPLAHRLVTLGVATEGQIGHAVAQHLELRARHAANPRLQPSLRPVARTLVRYH